MRYAIFTDIHANLEALEAVLAKIDELAQQQPVDHIWFLGDLVGYGPNPNECIDKLRERTQTIIAGNHDWAAVGKIDLDDFSAAARISAEWTALQLTEEHRDFLINLPERIEIDECTLVHGSPYGPLWEYLTSEVLAERSFQYFKSRYCFVGHTHVPIIYQQPDDVANTPTSPLSDTEQQQMLETMNGVSLEDNALEDEDTKEMAAVRPSAQANAVSSTVEGTITETSGVKANTESAKSEPEQEASEQQAIPQSEQTNDEMQSAATEDTTSDEEANEIVIAEEMPLDDDEDEESVTEITSEEMIASAEDRLNGEIEELLALLGLSQSMVQVTNEMIVPPEGKWKAPEGYRAIVNPGGVGQPRDGDPRAAFMIYDTEGGFTFYRVPYNIEKTQEKIIKAGLPQYLASRLEYGR